MHLSSSPPPGPSPPVLAPLAWSFLARAGPPHPVLPHPVLPPTPQNTPHGTGSDWKNLSSTAHIDRQTDRHCNFNLGVIGLVQKIEEYSGDPKNIQVDVIKDILAQHILVLQTYAPD